MAHFLRNAILTATLTLGTSAALAQDQANDGSAKGNHLSRQFTPCTGGSAAENEACQRVHDAQSEIERQVVKRIGELKASDNWPPKVGIELLERMLKSECRGVKPAKDGQEATEHSPCLPGPFQY
ncbi:MAG: hypothetical protein H6860_04190 [Rhodospirillales bacterium]|nr:hypothetical protein [Rhodospirillales bacterium]USO04767.1 MAG: hypothetical protein H6859_06250 [Rhodospirillales bacterium]HOO81078.1 hypothetical protein [Alphaproteobacteria bacterium]